MWLSRLRNIHIVHVYAKKHTCLKYPLGFGIVAVSLHLQWSLVLSEPDDARGRPFPRDRVTGSSFE